MSECVNCLQGGCGHEGAGQIQCKGCGFDRLEAQRRKLLLEHRGLSRRKNGLWTLKIGGKKNG